jgi:hypothetical protein
MEGISLCIADVEEKFCCKNYDTDIANIYYFILLIFIIQVIFIIMRSISWYKRSPRILCATVNCNFDQDAIESAIHRCNAPQAAQAAQAAQAMNAVKSNNVNADKFKLL